MAAKTQVAVFARRMPTQARARASVDAIFEATARIIEREGAAALSTNLIAECAGVSVGTLYEYFPNKQAVLIAMARRRLAEDAQRVRRVLADTIEDPEAPLVRIVIHALVALHRERPKVRRAIMAVHLAHGLSGEHAKSVQDVTELLLARSARLAGSTAAPLARGSLFVATRAVIGVIRAAFEERSQLLGSPQLEDELVRLVEAYLPELRRLGHRQ
jgi:AcrR family transcriptional regulator